MQSGVLLYDGHCVLCNNTVKLLLNYDKKHTLSFSPLNGNFAKELIPKGLNPNIDSVVLYHNNEFYYKSKAVFKILKLVKTPYRFLLLFSILPSFITDAVYSFIAKIRYKIFGKYTTCPLPPESFKKRFIP